MTAGDIYELVNDFAPFRSAEPYDNSGLLTGCAEAGVSGILLSLDCTRSAAEKAAETGANLIVTHHPVIFNPLKTLPADSVPFFLAAHGITVISAHTNLDAANGGVCDALCRCLGLKNVTARESGLRIGERDPVTPRGLAEIAAAALNCRPRFTEGRKTVRKIAVVSGSGGSFLEEADALNCDALITGDVKYSAFIEGFNLGITVIDAGHYETERIILPRLKELILRAFPNAAVEIFESDPVKTL